MLKPNIIEGGLFKDERGELRFVNEFDLSEVVRFYQITHPSTAVVRAWQGHEKEQKWFYCLSGSFIINLIQDFRNIFTTIIDNHNFEILMGLVQDTFQCLF